MIYKISVIVEETKNPSEFDILLARVLANDVGGLSMGCTVEAPHWEIIPQSLDGGVGLNVPANGLYLTLVSGITFGTRRGGDEE